MKISIYVLFLLLIPVTLLSQGYLYPELVEPFDFETTYNDVDFSSRLNYYEANSNIKIRVTQQELSRKEIPIDVGFQISLHASDFYSEILADTTVVLDTINVICDFQVEWGNGKQTAWVTQSTNADVVFHNKYYVEGNYDLVVRRRIRSTSNIIVENEEYLYDISVTSYFLNNSSSFEALDYGVITYNEANSSTANNVLFVEGYDPNNNMDNSYYFSEYEFLNELLLNNNVITINLNESGEDLRLNAMVVAKAIITSRDNFHKINR